MFLVVSEVAELYRKLREACRSFLYSSETSETTRNSSETSVRCSIKLIYVKKTNLSKIM